MPRPKVSNYLNQISWRFESPFAQYENYSTKKKVRVTKPNIQIENSKKSQGQITARGAWEKKYILGARKKGTPETRCVFLGISVFLVRFFSSRIPL